MTETTGVVYRHPDGSTEALNLGCVVDGHWGQYGPLRALEEYGSLQGTDLLAQLPQLTLTHCVRCGDLCKLTDYPKGDHAPRSIYNHAADPYTPHGPYAFLDLDAPDAYEWVLDLEESERQKVNDRTEGGSYEWVDGELFVLSDDELWEDD